MNEADLVRQFPRLWHMAEDGSWPSIEEHGLLSTSALVDLYGINGNERNTIILQRRSRSVPISRVGLPDAVIRDNIPMTDSALRKCLNDSLTPSQWYEILNGKVFFWLSQDRLRRLLGAKAYRDKTQTVLTIDTASLVNAYRNRISLSPINSGSTIMKPQPRGLDTFLPIAEYPYDFWKNKRSRKSAVIELVVDHSVPDIKDHVIAVHRVKGENRQELWRREETLLDDGP